MDYAAIHQEALDAATLAGALYIEKHGQPFYCGFAWVTIRPARGPFVTWCKKQIENTPDSRDQRAYGSRAYDGGWQFWGPGEYRGQSMAVKMAEAQAFALVLTRYGIEATVGGRAD